MEKGFQCDHTPLGGKGALSLTHSLSLYVSFCLSPPLKERQRIVIISIHDQVPGASSLFMAR